MTRTVCPQVKGIYGYNAADPNDEYACLLIVDNNPREFFSIDALKVNQDGEADPNCYFPITCLAEDFGDYVCKPYQSIEQTPEFIAALDLVYDLATGTTLLDDVDVDDDPELAVDRDQQRQALAVVLGYLQGHRS